MPSLCHCQLLTPADPVLVRPGGVYYGPPTDYQEPPWPGLSSPFSDPLYLYTPSAIWRYIVIWNVLAYGPSPSLPPSLPLSLTVHGVIRRDILRMLSSMRSHLLPTACETVLARPTCRDRFRITVGFRQCHGRRVRTRSSLQRCFPASESNSIPPRTRPDEAGVDVDVRPVVVGSGSDPSDCIIQLL